MSEDFTRTVIEKGNASQIDELEQFINLYHGIIDQNLQKVIQWTNDRDTYFLHQWAGPKLSYPLTENQIECIRESTWSIMYGDRFAGIIQIISRSGDTVHIGRFMINPDETGKGIGSIALNLFCKLLFDDHSIRLITLNVLSSNEAAIKCYRKCGFKVKKGLSDSENNRVQMQLERQPIISSAK